MFCEIVLGQILGPSPGQGSRTDLVRCDFAHAQSHIPLTVVRDFRRLYGWRDALIEAVRNGAQMTAYVARAVDALDRVKPAGARSDLVSIDTSTPSAPI